MWGGGDDTGDLSYFLLILISNQTKQLQQDEGRRCRGEETVLDLYLFSTSLSSTKRKTPTARRWTEGMWKRGNLLFPLFIICQTKHSTVTRRREEMWGGGNNSESISYIAPTSIDIMGGNNGSLLVFCRYKHYMRKNSWFLLSGNRKGSVYCAISKNSETTTTFSISMEMRYLGIIPANKIWFIFDIIFGYKTHSI